MEKNFKINISTKEGKTYKTEVDNEGLIGKKIGDKISGDEINSDLSGYELEITGASDIAGFPSKKDIDGVALKKVLLKKGWGMKQGKPKGLRKRKTVRGNVISEKIVQINTIVVKEGDKKLEDIFGKKGETSGKESIEKKPAEQESKEEVKSGE